MPQITRRTAALAALAAGSLGTAAAQAPAVRLFKVIGPRDEVTIGLTEAELTALGSGPEVERIARALVANGQLTAWQYIVGRAPDGSTRLAATRRIAVLRSESLRIEPYTAALPVAPPPAN
ncbi:hypothetical protein EJV46_10440 [Roseococcus sp. SYP-B2431]|uniref:hypothetical protein n=1 Tax=Roseococcus sp. SYP-B2431 TaxID=2496640 RepID=UPI00103956E5|nr:hypothetical protein [Roseococcus sp. SYP-B2431]TCH98962.1 hypothetical protein EJV46_10440 [Roseococcus sp. SYP-B2431]